MANFCACTFEIEFETEEEKTSFFNDIKDDIIDDDEILFFGTKDKYLLSASVRCSRENMNVVYISCDVDWAIEHDDMITFVDYIKNNHGKEYHVKSIKTSYEELMNDIIGDYVFDGKTLKDKFLTQKQIDDVYKKSDYSNEEFSDDENALDDYHKALYDELENNPTVKTIMTF